MTKHKPLLHFTLLSCILPYDKTQTSITFYVSFILLYNKMQSVLDFILLPFIPPPVTDLIYRPNYAETTSLSASMECQM